MMEEIGGAISKLASLKTLKMAFCSIYDDSMAVLQHYLSHNFSLVEIDLQQNPASDYWFSMAMV
jgi:hypothetical protein